MKTEQEIRERMDKVMQMLAKVDVTNKENEHKLLTISAVLRELDWVLSE